jgi:hypothetical protein
LRNISSIRQNYVVLGLSLGHKLIDVRFAPGQAVVRFGTACDFANIAISTFVRSASIVQPKQITNPDNCAVTAERTFAWLVKLNGGKVEDYDALVVLSVNTD